MKKLLKLPYDTNGSTVPLSPQAISLASTIDSSISTATDLTLHVDTNFIRVSAVSGGVYLKYATGVSATNNGFDEFIADGQTQDFAIPNSVTLISVIEKDSGAEVIIIEK